MERRLIFRWLSELNKSERPSASVKRVGPKETSYFTAEQSAEMLLLEKNIMKIENKEHELKIQLKNLFMEKDLLSGDTWEEEQEFRDLEIDIEETEKALMRAQRMIAIWRAEIEELFG